MARPGIQKHLSLAPLLRCPLCHQPMSATESSVLCEGGHDYAISSKGFLNLVPHQAPLKGYDETFFKSRQRIMRDGYYDCVRDGVIAALNAHPVAVHGATQPSEQHKPLVLDAGCGEGSYARSLHDALDCDVIGIDLARDAIRCAARGGGAERWLVADLANIPLADHSVNAIANIYTPANYREFQRVLRPGGLLVKVVPAPLHMRELRELAGERLGQASFVDHGVAEHLERHMEIASRTRVTATTPVRPESALDLMRMSPVAFGMNQADIDLDALNTITVDAEIICARPR